VSYKVTDWVWRESESRNGARLVMLAIADRADEDGRAWPSVEDIAERTRLSRRAVQKGVAELIGLGELEVDQGGGRARANRYRIIPKGRTSDAVSRTERTGEQRTSDAVTGQEPRTSDAVSPSETANFATRKGADSAQTANSATRKGADSTPEPARNHQRTGKEPQRAESRPAEIPDALAELKRAVAAAGLSGIGWRLRPPQWEITRQAVQRAGIPAMVAYAVHSARLKGLPAEASAWVEGWRSLEAAPEQDGVAYLPPQPAALGDPKLAARQASRARLDELTAQLRAQRADQEGRSA
jgi:hypothetical protein